MIVCRCNDVALEDVERAVREYGCRSLDCLRKLLHVGFGPCQGRLCLPVLARLLADRLGADPSRLGEATVRPPLRPVLAAWLLDAYQGGGEGGGP